MMVYLASHTRIAHGIRKYDRTQICTALLLRQGAEIVLN